MKPILAIISPSQNAYSETFIQAHKGIPGVEVKYYFGARIPKSLEGKGDLKFNSNGIIFRLFRFLKRKLKLIEPYDNIELLKKSFIKEKINVVLCEYGPTGVDMLELCKQMKLPLLVHFHGYDASRFDVLEIYKQGYLKMFEYASVIFSVSSVMTQRLIATGCPMQKIVQNTYGPNPIFLNIVPSLNKELFIAVGRFVDKKAPYYTLLAFKEVLHQFPNAQLIMAGNGPLYNMVLNLVKFYKLENNVKLVGVINPEQFASYLKEARAFVQHSIIAEDGDMEGTPVGILEACAAGVPVISTYHAGIPDVIEHDVYGLLCNEHDVSQMTENMLSVLQDKNYAVKLGALARNTIKDKFSLERHLEIISRNIFQSIGVS
jgi:colanic acid/amylovoran biosynthesis glycosyltransferase